jgi:hypothetical protein
LFSNHASKKKKSKLSPKPLPSLSQWHHISDNNFRQRNHASCPNTLQASSNKHDGKVIRNCRNDRTDSEESQGYENQGLPAEDMGERGIAGLRF